MDEKDLYAILGVSRTATVDEIRRAYRKLARRYHPDVNPGNKEAEERFKEISFAYEVLSDPEKRRKYDEFGMLGLQAGFDAEAARQAREQAAWTAGGGPWREYAGFGRYATFEDIFGDIFGPEARPGGPQPGPDVESTLEIDLLDAIRGTTTTFTLDREDVCTACDGSGRDRGAEAVCSECRGQGRVQAVRGPMTLLRTCPRCGGTGRTSTRPCPACAGAGTRTVRDQLRVHIPAGVDTGSRVRVANKGGPGRHGGPPGDLYLLIRVRPHPLLERRDRDLYLNVPVTVGEAALGATIQVPTPDGDVRLRVPPGSQSGRLLRIRGRGVPALKGTARGDLYIRVMVHVPHPLTPEQEAAVRTLERAYTTDVRRGLQL